MCSNYQPVTRMDRMLTFFGVERAKDEPTKNVFPLGMAPFIRLTTEGTEGGQPAMLVDDGMFGLLPNFATELAYGRRTYNARSETVAKLPSFRHAWANSQRCIIPAESFYEPSSETGMRSGGESVNPVMCLLELLASTGEGRTRQAGNCSRSLC